VKEGYLACASEYVAFVIQSQSSFPSSLQVETLREEFAIDLRVLGIASSKSMLLRERGVDLDTWRDDLQAHGRPVDMAVRDV
jgi:hypothetical protein